LGSSGGGGPREETAVVMGDAKFAVLHRELRAAKAQMAALQG